MTTSLSCHWSSSLPQWQDHVQKMGPQSTRFNDMKKKITSRAPKTTALG